MVLLKNCGDYFEVLGIDFFLFGWWRMKVENLIRVGEKGECIFEFMLSDEWCWFYLFFGIVKVVKFMWLLDGVEYLFDFEGGCVNYEMFFDRFGFFVMKFRVNGKM